MLWNIVKSATKEQEQDHDEAGERDKKCCQICLYIFYKVLNATK